MPTPRVRTVAVIDDDQRVRKSLANLLASGGYATRAYEPGQDFLADSFPDLVCVITDLGMRPVDGMQVLDRTVRSAAATPVIIITGRPGEQVDDYYLKRGALGFFRKPVDGNALLDLLDSIA
jgi:FixJ family two-component response regulator